MALINIDTSNDDPFYRYKMPKLITKVGSMFMKANLPMHNSCFFLRYLHKIAFPSVAILAIASVQSIVVCRGAG
jgi:hypothetical protein